MKTALLFWSGGKDSAWALREFTTGENPGKVTALLTTYDRRTGRVPMHDVPIEWIEQQAKQLRLPVWTIPLPFPCSNAEYLEALKPFYGRADVDGVLFGDLFLADIRKFREDSLAGTGLEVWFPLWGRDTKKLANEMIWAGIQAKITGIDRDKLDGSFLGRAFNAELLEALPEGVTLVARMGSFTLLSKIRIASFIASATEIVDALGAFDSLVGRSHECDFPHGIEKLPVCTRPKIEVSGNSLEIDQQVKANLANALSIYEVLDDVLEALQPTHILTQTQCEVCAVSLKDVERSVAAKLASAPKIVPLQPNCLADIWEDIRRVACSLGMLERGEEVIGELQRRMRQIAEAATTKRPTVACIEWLAPLMAAGNWVPELVEMAGGVNLFGEAGKHSPWMTWEELVARDPDVIVVMPCGFDEARTRSEMYWMTGRPEYAGLKAARTGQVHPVDGNQYFNRPGPRVVESLQILSEILRAV